MIYINNLKLQIIKQINSGQKKLTFFGYIQFTYYYYYVQILQISSKFIQQQKAQSLFDILQKAMTQVTNTFANIKRQLLTFQHSEQQMRQRLNHINQTRSKINNQLVNLTKDYERKIKQLQYRLEEVVNKNQQLQKQNKLCRKQIQSIEQRLLQKQKLIAMLISQQTERFSSQTYLGKNKSQNFNKGKDSKKNYQIILPKSINTVQTINFPNQPNEKNQKQEQYANKQGNKQGYFQNKTQRNDNKNKKFDKTHKGGNYGQQIHPLISIEQQLSKNQQYGDQINNKQDNMKDLNEANQQQRFQNEQINTSKTKATVPPPPPQKRKTKPTQVPKNIKKTTPSHQQQINSTKNQDHIQNIEGKILQQTKDQSSKFNDEIQKTDNLHSQQKNEIQQIKDKNIQPSQNKSRIPPPPLKNKSTQKKNVPIPTFQQKFLQDSPPKAQQKHQQLQNKLQAQQNVQNNNQNVQQFQVLQQQNQDKKQKYNTPLNEAFGFEHINQQNKQKQSRIQIQQNMPEQNQQNVNQQIEQSYRRVPPPPPPKKSSKNKAKATPKIPRNIKTFQQHHQQQTSNIQQTNQSQQQYHQQQQYQQHSSNPNLNNNPNNKFQQIPHSSQDFFANLATQQNNQQDYGYQNKMIQAQQSSIDYADTHSIVSSSAAYMLDSQYIPQQSSAFKQTTTPEIKKMQKKKQGKRQVKSIDPQSFV